MSEVSDDQKSHWLHISSECIRIKTLPKITETIIIRSLWGWELNIVMFDTMSLFIKIYIVETVVIEWYITVTTNIQWRAIKIWQGLVLIKTFKWWCYYDLVHVIVVISTICYYSSNDMYLLFEWEGNVL